MTERASDTLRCDPGDLRQAMSIHTQKITDGCRDKDCIEDLRVYLTVSSQETLNSAANTRVRCAELITTAIDVSPVAFNRSHYCIDLTFYYRILADAVIGANRPTTLYGLAAFTKRAVLCGEDSRAHIYRSDRNNLDSAMLLQASLPTAVVEILDPMVLSSKVLENSADGDGTVPVSIPDSIQALFDEPLVVTGGQRQLYVTLGQFSIIRLERETQLTVPVLDTALPCKECCEDGCGGNEDPCEMFSRIPFPAREFSSVSCEAPGDCPEYHTTC